MSLKIKASSFVNQRWLEVDSAGVVFCDAPVGGGTRYRFDQIDLILMSHDNTLSFQVGHEVFKIPVQPGNEKHQQVVNALIQEARRTL